jgi:hypothetical protein
MADEPIKNDAITNALQRRKSLQEAIRKYMQELEQIDLYLKMHRKFSASDTEDRGSIEASGTLGSTTGWGHGQETFENFARIVLRDLQRPLQSGEIVEEFRRRGHPIGGANETKQAWNKLWAAKTRNVLVHVPKLGYWLADEPLPASALATPKPKRTRPVGTAHRATGRPIGRQRLLDDNALKKVDDWVASGMTIPEICRQLGGVSTGTFHSYFPEGIRGIRKRIADKGKAKKR